MNTKTDKGEARRPANFDELFNNHQEKVLLAAYRVTGNLQDAEDVLQSVFLRLLKRQDQALSADNTGAYLCKSAINASLDLLRSRRRNPTESINEETLPSSHGAAEGDALQSEQRRHLRLALLALDQRAAEVFALRMFEDFSNIEIAALLDTSPNSVAVAFHKARAQLQHTLGELEGENR
ncbi:MAG: RNA polymerase sigma factor [Pseudohongiellaceae bacterium]